MLQTTRQNASLPVEEEKIHNDISKGQIVMVFMHFDIHTFIQSWRLDHSAVDFRSYCKTQVLFPVTIFTKRQDSSNNLADRSKQISFHFLVAAEFLF